MKIFFAETAPDYSSYTFPYGIYALPGDEAEIAKAYSTGYLPYTGNPEVTRSVFYKARSLRIDLTSYSDRSENRRVAKKFDAFAIEVLPGGRRVLDSDAFSEFALKYSEARFKGGEMSRSRLKYITVWPFLTDVLVFKSGERVLGYLLYCAAGDHFHYWFSFYDLDFPDDLPLGKYLMWRSIHYARDAGFKYIYLGTCYGAGALYKARDFKAVEFHDGNSWRAGLKLLKANCKRDDENVLNCADTFKASADMNNFIEGLE